MSHSLVCALTYVNEVLYIPYVKQFNFSTRRIKKDDYGRFKIIMRREIFIYPRGKMKKTRSSKILFIFRLPSETKKGFLCLLLFLGVKWVFS
jgi:hypothetical protein